MPGSPLSSGRIVSPARGACLWASPSAPSARFCHVGPGGECGGTVVHEEVVTLLSDTGHRKIAWWLGVQGGLQRGGGRQQMCEAGRSPQPPACLGACPLCQKLCQRLLGLILGTETNLVPSWRRPFLATGPCKVIVPASGLSECPRRACTDYSTACSPGLVP